METGTIIHGFEITKKRFSEELKGTLYEMRHLKTRAELIFLDNKADNKLFSVAFKTLPWDDTGVFHILEHSVLAGSENYPVKEPFLDLLKSSMNTFLNAMTFPDKTVYPVSSRNDRDFLNLAGVYLDAVFKPAIYHNESIFRQEGWHYELDENGKPFYNGVVFNEMKGALGSVDGQMERNTMKYLYPDSIYGFESGGDPKAIPDLTYENFLRAHSEFYAPSNARIYLDGDVPLDGILSLIDEKYLSTFDYKEQEHEIVLQKPIFETDVEEYYEIGKEESEENKTQFVLGKVFADWSERKRIMAYSLISSYLTGTNESPLKRAVLEKGLAQDVEFSIQDGIAQPFFSIVFRNTEKEKKDEIINLYTDTLTKLSENGLDKEELSATLNQFEFALRETEEPQGLVRNINLLSSWLYGGDAMLYLENNGIVKELRDAVGTGYYEEIARELTDFSGMLKLTVLPSKTKGDDERELEEKRVTAEYGSFSDEEKKRVNGIYENMRKWQDTPDSPEAKATLPVLSLSDVKKEPMWTSTKVIGVKNTKVLFHQVNTNGIIHAYLYFDISDVKSDELSHISLLTDLFSVLPTKKHSPLELQKEIKKTIGALDFGVDSYTKKGSPLETKTFFTVCLSVLEQNIGRAVELILEILLETDFRQKDIIKENVLQANEALYQSIMNSGYLYGCRRALSSTSASAFTEDITKGFTMQRYLSSFADNFDEKIDAFIDYAEKKVTEIFVSDRLTLSETSPSYNNSVEAVVDALPRGKGADCLFTIEKTSPKKEAILIPSGISFAVLGTNINSLSYLYNGSLSVLSIILTYGYLWNEIRVHGGAYGCGFRSPRNGNTTFHSYRDPNPLNSIRVYKETSSFIKGFVESDEIIDKYIISSVAATESLMSTARQGIAADTAYFTDFTFEEKQKIRNEMLSLKKEDLLSLCEMFDSLSENASVCIIGSENALSDLSDDWTVFRL